ncbi:GntR family transcriptional regulator [Luteimonas sp. TWI1416]|uniref:GntR family transcriptional regulator n=1 Tax=unclassified Luteimonas TaxID=2629088 RepID=UPI003209E726
MDLKIDHAPITLREKCLERLRDAIITGHFAAGARLVERTLCEQLGVSRSVVREVIRHLQAEGLVDVLANKGPIVAPLDWSTAHQVYEIRLLLEQSAVAACTGALTDDIVARIRGAQQALQTATAAQDMAQILRTSSHLYETIFVAANQGIAWDIVRRLNGRISRLRAMTLRDNRRERSGQSRIDAICDAICIDRDPVLAKTRVAEHISEVATIARRILASDAQA